MKTWITRRQYPAPKVLFLMFVVVIGIWGLIELSDEVIEGDTATFDEWVITSLRRPQDLATPIGPAWLQEAARDLTALGGYTVLGVLIAIVTGFLWLSRHRKVAIYVLLAAVLGVLISQGLKRTIGRPRPDIVPHLTDVTTAAFPSGHSMMAAVVYLTLGALIVPLVERRLQVYVLTVAIILTLLIGTTRIYLGVHYPTDVLAGWTAGSVWAIVCSLVFRWLQRRGAVQTQPEPETKSPG
ncbi:MAG: phosphatase PAP2 family protein [Pirellulales bacterium]